MESKTTTTVALDFGRITFDRIALYLFGTPGQSRFRFLWDDLVDGALGTVVLVDARRIEECFFPAVDHVEARGAPFVLAVNRFDGAERVELDRVRTALGLNAEIPVLECDARDAGSYGRCSGRWWTG